MDAAPNVPQNNVPEHEEGSVFDQIILRGHSIRPIKPVFDDPNGDGLTFAFRFVSYLLKGVDNDEDTGIIGARALARTCVRHLRVEATDPYGESAISELFYSRALVK